MHNFYKTKNPASKYFTFLTPCTALTDPSFLKPLSLYWKESATGLWKHRRYDCVHVPLRRGQERRVKNAKRWGAERLRRVLLSACALCAFCLPLVFCHPLPLFIFLLQPNGHPKSSKSALSLLQYCWSCFPRSGINVACVGKSCKRTCGLTPFMDKDLDPELHFCTSGV